LKCRGRVTGHRRDSAIYSRKKGKQKVKTDQGKIKRGIRAAQAGELGMEGTKGAVERGKKDL